MDLQQTTLPGKDGGVSGVNHHSMLQFKTSYLQVYFHGAFEKIQAFSTFQNKHLTSL